jgi:hypothetical protein
MKAKEPTPKSDEAHSEFRLLPFARKLELENKRLKKQLRELRSELRARRKDK